MVTKSLIEIYSQIFQAKKEKNISNIRTIISIIYTKHDIYNNWCYQCDVSDDVLVGNWFQTISWYVLFLIKYKLVKILALSTMYYKNFLCNVALIYNQNIKYNPVSSCLVCCFFQPKCRKWRHDRKSLLLSILLYSESVVII